MVQTRFQVEIVTAGLGYLSVRMQVSESTVLRGCRCLFMEEGHFASLVPHTQVSEHPWIKAEFQEIFLEFFGFLYPLNFGQGAQECFKHAKSLN